ncbi:hypothetical protein [Parapedobacter tibetensis]|uniref:hypothetical protein n=1 Tax=Parapedobacter tibetensis TaxID=2972951 RepID=UPI00214DE2E5|nr:hypothetical protein [Parapedobacter tibetensis]
MYGEQLKIKDELLQERFVRNTELKEQNTELKAAIADLKKQLEQLKSERGGVVNG